MILFVVMLALRFIVRLQFLSDVPICTAPVLHTVPYDGIIVDTVLTDVILQYGGDQFLSR